MTSAFSTDELNKILKQNCFEVFNLPLQFKIDLETLNTKYQTLQKQLHPDNFINHPDSLLSTMVSAHVNSAYNTLNSPLLKTIELLHQNGISFDLNEDKILPPEFLMLQMELYEEIEDANGNTEQLEKLAQKLVNITNNLDNEIANNFAVSNFSAVIDNAKKLAFYNKLRSLIDQKIEESW